MRIKTRPALLVVAAIIIFVAGFILLLKGCLSQFDERFAHAPALVFEKEGKTAIFVIVEDRKTRSYSSKNGVTRKSFRTHYFIQSNDGQGQELQKLKVKKSSQVKNHPVEVMGSSAQKAWVFIGELMAFDPFTLEKFADTRILETKNPSLAGKFPKERQYYKFNTHSDAIFITANDGSEWKLNTSTLLMQSAEDEEMNEGSLNQKISALEKMEKDNDVAADTANRQRSREISRRYAAHEINSQEYSRLLKALYAERDSFRFIRDSFRTLIRSLEQRQRGEEDLERRLENLERGNLDFSNIKSNQDTLNDNWYGLFAKSELPKPNDQFSYRTVYDQTARRNFHFGKYSTDPKKGNRITDLGSTSISFLDGGFLLDKSTARPVHCNNPSGFLVVAKDKLGAEGKIQLSRIGLDGKQNWVFDSGLGAWKDWIVKGNKLFVLGADDKDLSGSQSNLLWCVDLVSGKATKHEYSP